MEFYTRKNTELPREWGQKMYSHKVVIVATHDEAKKGTIFNHRINQKGREIPMAPRQNSDLQNIKLR
jgi:hypothetical protein